MIATVDSRIGPELIRGLMLQGYRVNTLPPMSDLPKPMASHTDMLIARLGDDLITYADYCDSAAFALTDVLAEAPHLRMHFCDERPGAVYPDDARLNVLAMGKTLFCKEDSVSPYLLRLARERGYSIVPVRQGYPACTVLKLNEDAAITADEGMAKILEGSDIRVYRIQNGGISLPPYEYGFIGGAAGVHRGKVFFLGNHATHPSYKQIEDAIRAEGLTSVALGGGGLVDLGGILFV